MTEQTSFTFPIREEQVAFLRGVLEEQGFEFREVPHAHYGARRGHLNVNVYTSGKLLVQGRGAREFVEFTIEPRILGEAHLGYEEVHHPEMFQPHIGIDESGKGDFFGPLVIAGAHVIPETAHALLKMGVKDSKRIKSDRKAEEMSDSIRECLGDRACAVVAIGPAKYNELYGKFRNLNRLLAWGHATVIETLLERNPECPRALSDQFGAEHLIRGQLKERGRKIVLEQRTKAESDLAVAAASILARAEFIRRLRRLGEEAGVALPKGASAQVLEVAKQIFREKGNEALGRLSKSHFKTFGEASGAS